MQFKNASADGLRGLAALNVAMTHFVGAFLPMMLHKNYQGAFPENTSPSRLFEIATSPLVSMFYNGHLAVLIFFVLSGYVLSMPYFRMPDTARAILAKRLAGRYFRLNIPIAAAVAASFGLYVLGLYKNGAAAAMSGSITWLGSFFPVGIGADAAVREGAYQSIMFGVGNLIPPIWTLKIEFLGSIYLLLYYILRPRGSSIVIWLLLMGLVHAIHRENSLYYIAIFIGSALNRLHLPKRWQVPVLMMGVYFGAFQFQSSLYTFLPVPSNNGLEIWDKKTFYSTIGAVLITLPVIRGCASRLFQHSFVQYLGRISFSLYLIHFLVLCSLSSSIFMMVGGGLLGLMLNFLVYIGVSFAAAMCFERYVDRGAINVSHKLASALWLRRQIA